MREEKLLVRILRDLAVLVGDEASRNPEFAGRLEAILRDVPARKKKTRHERVVPDGQLPDVFSEIQAKPPEEFEQWLATLELPILKALVRKHDLDSSRRTQRWREPAKFAKLISEIIRARMKRGASFLGGSSGPDANKSGTR